MKHLSVDLGEKRIGIAVSDNKGIIAQPAAIIERTSDDEVISQIADMCTEKKIEKIVFGVPYSAKEETQKKFREFSQKLAQKTGLEVAEWDETFSTKQAQNVVAFADSPGGRKKTATHRDDVAAAVILQEYLDYEKSH